MHHFDNLVKKNKKKKKELDHSSLAFSFHSAMLTGFIFIQDLIMDYGNFYAQFCCVLLYICNNLTINTFLL